MSLVQVDINTDGIDDFATKYNNVVTFLDGGFAPNTSGSLATPAYAFDGDANTGFFSPAADQVALSLGGVRGFLATGSLITIDLATTLSSTLDVDGLVTLNLGLEVTAGGLDVTGNSVFNNNVTVTAGGLDVTGASSFDGTVTVSSGGIDVTGNSQVDGTLITTNNFTSGGSIEFSTNIAGVTRERLINTSSRVRQLFMASF